MDILKVITALVDYVDEQKIKEEHEIDRPTRELIRIFAELDGCSKGEMLIHIVRDFAIGRILEEEEARAIEAMES
jgi:hypothetical protein